MHNKNTSESTLTAWHIGRSALPIGAFYLTEILVGMTDLAVVGALGTDALAAVGLGKTILLSILVIGFAILSIGAVLMAEQPEPSLCGKVVCASLVVSIPVIFIAAFVTYLTPSLLALGGYDSALISLFSDYTVVLLLALPFALLFSTLKNVLNAYSRTGAIFWLSIGIVGGNLVGSILLVHGVGTWDGMGVQGAAWATVGVNIVASVCLFLHAIKTGFLRFKSQRVVHILKSASEIAKLGWAAGAQQALESMLFIIVLYLLGMHSGQWLAAGTVVFSIMELNYAASGALGEVVAARIAAQRIAEGDLRALLYLGMRMVGFIAIALAAFVCLFVDETVFLFTSRGTEAEALELMASLLLWTAPFFLMDAWQIFFINALRGLRSTVLPMILSTSCYWIIGIGGGIALSQFSSIGVSGIWIGFCLGLTSAAILLGILAFKATDKDF